MSRKIIYSILGLTLLVCCNNYQSCKGIGNRRFAGYALSFYHMPVSGSSYELFIFPVCNPDSILLSRNLNKNINSINLLQGLSYTVDANNKFFTEIIKKSQKFKLTNNQTLANQFSEIYVCPLFIEFDSIQNNTESITGSRKKKLQKKLVFENGTELKLSYILSNQAKAKVIRAL